MVRNIFLVNFCNVTKRDFAKIRFVGYAGRFINLRREDAFASKILKCQSESSNPRKEIDKFKNKRCPGIVMYKTRNSYGQLYRNT